MKKTIVLVLTITLLSTIICFSAAAESNSNQIALTDLTDEEFDAICKGMSARNVWGGTLRVEAVYDANDEPSYLLGLTDAGYIILIRETLLFCECGRGILTGSMWTQKNIMAAPMPIMSMRLTRMGTRRILI